MDEDKPPADKPEPRRSAAVPILLGVVVLTIGVYARLNPQAVRDPLLSLAGPPSVAMAEAYAHSHDRWFRFDKLNHTVYLAKLYDWYGGDFESVADSVLDYVAGHVPDLRAALDAGNEPKVRWLDYDWKLNDISNAP